MLRVHLIPRLGARRLSEITNADIQQVKAQMTASSPKTVNNVLTCLSKLLKVAVEWGVIDRMPCTIKLLKPGEGRMAFREFSEYERLIAAAARLDSGTLVAVLLGGDAGLRAGEMRALEWTDIDLKARKRFVARSEWRSQIGITKGDRMRMVPMTTRLTEALRKHRHLKGDHVLCQADGTPIVGNTLSVLDRTRGQDGGIGDDTEAERCRAARAPSHVLFAPGDARGAAEGDSGSGGAPGPGDHAALHAPEPVSP